MLYEVVSGIQCQSIIIPNADAKFFYEDGQLGLDYSNVVLLEADKLKALWVLLDPRDKAFIEDPVTTWTPLKLADVIEGITSGPAIRIPVGRIMDKGFGDGRHRTRFLIELGVSFIPVQLHSGLLDNVGAKTSELKVLQPRTSAVELAVAAGFQAGLSPFDIWKKQYATVSTANSLHASTIVDAFEKLALEQLKCLEARTKLMRKHVNAEYQLSPDLKYMEKHMQAVVGRIQEWRKDNGLVLFANAGAAVSGQVTNNRYGNLIPPNWRSTDLPQFCRQKPHCCEA